MLFFRLLNENPRNSEIKLKNSLYRPNTVLVANKLPLKDRFKLWISSHQFSELIKQYSLLECFYISELSTDFTSADLTVLLDKFSLGTVVKTLSLSGAEQVSDSHIYLVAKNFKLLQTFELYNAEVSFAAIQHLMRSLATLEFVELYKTLSNAEIRLLQERFPQVRFGFAEVRALNTIDFRSCFPPHRLGKQVLCEFSDSLLPISAWRAEENLLADFRRRQVVECLFDENRSLQEPVVLPDLSVCALANTLNQVCVGDLRTRTVYSNNVSPRAGAFPVSAVTVCRGHANVLRTSSSFFKCENCRKLVVRQSWVGLVCKRCKDLMLLESQTPFLDLQRHVRKEASLGALLEKPVELLQPKNFDGVLTRKGELDLEPLYSLGAQEGLQQLITENARMIEENTDRFYTELKKAKRNGCCKALLVKHPDSDKVAVWAGSDVNRWRWKNNKLLHRHFFFFFVFLAVLFGVAVLLFQSEEYAAFRATSLFAAFQETERVSEVQRMFPKRSAQALNWQFWLQLLFGNFFTGSCMLLYCFLANNLRFLSTVYFCVLVVLFFVFNLILSTSFVRGFLPEAKSNVVLDVLLNTNLSVGLAKAVLSGSPVFFSNAGKLGIQLYLVFFMPLVLGKSALLIFVFGMAAVLVQFVLRGTDFFTLFLEVEEPDMFGFELPFARKKRLFLNFLTFCWPVGFLAALADYPTALVANALTQLLVCYLYLCYAAFRRRRVPFLSVSGAVFAAFYLLRKQL